jgi:hypothetical protein
LDREHSVAPAADALMKVIFMDLRNPNSDDDYEWRRSFIFFPRVAKMMSREGVRTEWIWPGAYLVRKSRTLRGRIYRRATD